MPWHVFMLPSLGNVGSSFRQNLKYKIGLMRDVKM